jgi:hypothetical protein
MPRARSLCHPQTHQPSLPPPSTFIHNHTHQQEMYLKRKSFAFNSDRPGAGGEEGRDIFERALKTGEWVWCVGLVGCGLC